MDDLRGLYASTASAVPRSAPGCAARCRNSATLSRNFLGGRAHEVSPRVRARPGPSGARSSVLAAARTEIVQERTIAGSKKAPAEGLEPCGVETRTSAVAQPCNHLAGLSPSDLPACAADGHGWRCVVAKFCHAQVGDSSSVPGAVTGSIQHRAEVARLLAVCAQDHRRGGVDAAQPRVCGK